MAFPIESYAAKIQRKLLKKQRVIEAASGRQKADLVLKNATYVNVFSNELLTCDIAVANGLIVGLGSYEGEVEYDMTGKIVCPGFVDAHIHLESSLVTPKEFVRATLPHGTTTVITDPHEITNVMGTDGIDYMFQATEGLPIDVRFMLPSCVPATPSASGSWASVCGGSKPRRRWLRRPKSTCRCRCMTRSCGATSLPSATAGGWPRPCVSIPSARSAGAIRG